MEATYITCPLYALLNHYQKLISTFLTQTVLSDSINKISIYTEGDFISNNSYNECILPQNLSCDFYKSLQLYACHREVVNMGDKWVKQIYFEMEKWYKKIQELIKTNPFCFPLGQ